MSITRRPAFALICVALLLAGCGGPSDQGNAAAREATGGTGDTQVAERVNGYTEGYNALLGTFGLPETARTYLEAGIAAKTARDTINVTDGAIDTALVKLKAARVLPGAMPVLDRDADALIASLDTLLARLGPLATYYESKAYKDDALRRGKAEDAAMAAEFRASMAAADRFETALGVARRARLDGELKRLQDAGDTLGYNTKLALKHAEDLVTLFKTPDAISDPARYARGDALVATLEKLLAEQRAAFAAAQAKAAPGDQPSPAIQSVMTMLSMMIGDYRDMRESKSPNEFESMVRNYNNAIQIANVIR